MTKMAAGEGAVSGGVRAMIRLEGAAVFLAATGAYFTLGGAWWVYLVLLFSPDLSFLGYGLGPRIGAAIYNGAHSFALSVGLGALGLALGSEPLGQLALIHAAHIGLDRSLGYGLKYSSGFGSTHLGLIGPAARSR